MSVTLYETMFLDRGATQAEVKAKWRELASQLHPDKYVGKSGKVQVAAAARFAEVSAAHAVLSDPSRRAAYDKQLDLLTDPCPACKGKGRTWKQEGFAKKVPLGCKPCGGSGRVARPKKEKL